MSAFVSFVDVLFIFISLPLFSSPEFKTDNETISLLENFDIWGKIYHIRSDCYGVEELFTRRLGLIYLAIISSYKYVY